MKRVRKNKSSNELALKDDNLKQNHEEQPYILKTENKEKFLFDFISDKNKIKFQSHFDKNGAKKFLSDKDKAMEKIILSDDILDENGKKKKKHKDKDRNKKPRRSISDNFAHLKKKEKVIKPSKNLKKTDMIININYVDDKKSNDNTNNNKNSNLFNSKKNINKHNSISSSYSNIYSSSPMNLAVNKNDSLIFSIVSEMSKN